MLHKFDLRSSFLPGDYRVLNQKVRRTENRKAVFIDLDGTLWTDLGPGTILQNPIVDRQELLKLREISNRGYALIGITNQTYFGYRTKLNPMVVMNYRSKMKSLVKDNILDAVYVCHHHPDSKITHLRRDCSNRKPQAGLIDWAAREFNLDLINSFAVGDRITDIVAARESRIGKCFLIANPRCLEWNISSPMASKRLINFNISIDLKDALEAIEEAIS